MTVEPRWTKDLRDTMDDVLQGYREGLRQQLNGLTEEEARRSLVPSKTTLLGLVKHLTYVERFYLDHCVTGRTLKEIGVASTPDRSFVLKKSDTIASICEAYEQACDDSRQTLADLGFDEIVTGPRGERAVWDLSLQVLRELAHHSGHADILREQVDAARSTG